ncbi:PDDEXK nuclease domain-containing protein [Ferruginibacter profundus]
MQKRKPDQLITEIKALVTEARNFVATNINTQLLYTYWQIGNLLVRRERSDKMNEASLSPFILEMSKHLSIELGKGFSRSNLFAMRSFYLHFALDSKAFKNVLTVSGQKISASKKAVLTVSGRSKKMSLKVSPLLSWSHYYELLKCGTELEISFYQQTAIKENWSVRELRRQIDTALFERIALSKNAKEVLHLAKNGKAIKQNTDLIKSPYILEFLNIPENYKVSERFLEQKIIDNLQHFILELGKGFAFIGRQYRVTLNNKHYYIDLVFYHRILKCFVLIDLKVKDLKHQDVGQMNLYLNYFETEQNVEGDNPPIGIILTKQKDDITVEYALRGISNKIFVSKYQLYLPEKKMLQKKLKELL